MPLQPTIQNHNLHLKFQSLASGGCKGSEFASGYCCSAQRHGGLRAKPCKGKGVFAVGSEYAVKVVESEGSGRRESGSEGFDAIVIGSGIGGLVAGTQLAVKGARVLVLEKYVIPGGSSGFYQRDGYTFDVGSSVMFGFSDKVSLLLLLLLF